MLPITYNVNRHPTHRNKQNDELGTIPNSSFCRGNIVVTKYFTQCASTFTKEVTQNANHNLWKSKETFVTYTLPRNYSSGVAVQKASQSAGTPKPEKSITRLNGSWL